MPQLDDLPLFQGYDLQRFEQFSPADCANWYEVACPTGKQGKALYPAMGRRHVRLNGRNLLNFGNQPRKVFRSIDYQYTIEGSNIWRINSSFNATLVVGSELFTRTAGILNFAYLPVVTIPNSGPPVVQNVFCMLVDGENTWIIDETTNTLSLVTDVLRPPFPATVAAFGNRFVVGTFNSTQFQLTQINVGGTLDVSNVFNVPGVGALFAQESGLIRQMAVLQNQLYMFTDFNTGIWSNTPSVFNNATFPWRKNTSFEFNYGIADPDSLDVDFGMMTWLGRNKNGLVTFMTSSGQDPKPIGTQAINVLLQKIANANFIQPLLTTDTIGFLYQYEDTIFYRVTIGPYVPYMTLEDNNYSTSLEYNFTTKKWIRCIELNGQRNRIVDHQFYNNKHLVTVEGQTCLFEMAGDIYVNELQNPDPNITLQSPVAFIAYPMRYELITPIIHQKGYWEWITKYIEIDFVWGMGAIPWDNSFQNIVFIIGEQPDGNGDPIYCVTEDGNSYIIQDGTNTPTVLDQTYYDLFNPHIELYISDDGGITYYTADLLEFSPLGIYSWRMRWYQGNVSRNRVYKLVCVSPSPIVILGGVHEWDRASGGAN